MKPQRVQLRRTKGWRKPPGVVVVSRPSKWGNPYRVLSPGIQPGRLYFRTAEAAVAAYRRGLFGGYRDWPTLEQVRAELRGKDLACWCPLGQPCHADVLIEVANS